MLFSCLVDADDLETEAFYDRICDRPARRDAPPAPGDLIEALERHLVRLGRGDGLVNRLRGEILDHVRNGAEHPPGVFSLTVPTGGGKTLASLAFGLAHARVHGMGRVIYVIPYTSIAEQTADVFRRAVGEDAVLEHHSSFDWAGLDQKDEEERLRAAAQTWDRPVIVTTAVQFLETLLSNRNARCRKLHRIARSVVILDEAQTLPHPLLRPSLAASGELVRGYGTSIVLFTATQPALTREDGFAPPEALRRAEVTELAPDPPRNHTERWLDLGSTA